MKELLGILFVVIFCLGLTLGLFALGMALPGSRELFYKDQMLMCHQEDNWGWNNQVTTCYKVMELNQ